MHLNGSQTEFRNRDPGGRMEDQTKVGMHYRRTEVESGENELRDGGENKPRQNTPGLRQQQNQRDGKEKLRLKDHTTQSNAGHPIPSIPETKKCKRETKQDQDRELAAHKEME